MNEKIVRLWADLYDMASRSKTPPDVSVSWIGERASLEDGAQFGTMINWLREVGAIQFISDEEMAEIASGGHVPGEMISLDFGDEHHLLRINDPVKVEVQLRAQVQLLRKAADAASNLAQRTRGTTVAAKIGITPDQLAEGLSIPLSDDDWRMYASMGDDFFARAWKRQEAEGNASAMMRLLAALARMDKEDRASAEQGLEALSRASAALELLRARPTSEAASTRDDRREPIREEVRHEVWRRDQGRCVECGSQERLEFDHIIPVSKGGANTARNLRLLCEQCNRVKGDRT